MTYWLFNYNIDNLLKENKVDDLKELSEINSPAGVIEMFKAWWKNFNF